jgi:hypothetical protein
MSKIEVNAVEPQCGTTLTLGASGDTVQLGTGASQSGFGRTGTVDWDTTVKTAAFTAENGKGYFVNTTSGAITVTLPASPSAGNIVAVMDYANTAATNNITVGRNSSKIDGESLDATIKVNGQSFTLIYIDSTEGWKTVNNANAQIETKLFVAATGGTITTCGDYKIHTFTAPGTFTVSCAGNPEGSATLDYLVVAGGGGSGSKNCGNGPAGGGAGGFRYSAATYTSPSCAPGHPLRSPTGLTAVKQSYPVTVGAGGAGSTCSGPTGSPGSQGANSVFSTITSAGGGYGAWGGDPAGSGDGGSGGGNPSNRCHTCTPSFVGAGNTPPVSPPQGNPGGTKTTDNDGSGGGGAGAKAPDNPPGTCAAGGGGAGAGIPTAFGCNGETCGSFQYYAGGGAGGARLEPGASVQPGGIGGGGDASNPSATGNATANTGGGGGGGRGYPNPPGTALAGGSGGSGIVVIRYKFQ